MSEPVVRKDVDGKMPAGGSSRQREEVERECAKAVKEFRRVFGRPELGAYAPGRVNLMGGSIDYSGGPVIPVALQLVTVIVGRRSPNGDCRVVTLARTNQISDEDADHTFPVPTHPSKESHSVDIGGPQWAKYLKGVVALMNKNGDVPGFEAVIVSSVPLGGGLSSSAALEVATYKFLEQLCPQTGRPDLKQAALLCQEAEHRYANVPCGLMDQFVSMMAKESHALYIDCSTQEVEHLPLTDPNLALLIINSEYRHDLSETSTEGDRDYSSRRRTCENISSTLGIKWLRDLNQTGLEASRDQLSEVAYKRATHAVSEIDRSIRSRTILKQGKYREFGQLMTLSHYSLRDNYEVTVEELDEIVELTLRGHEGQTVYGSHLSGGGFGGCIVTLLHRDAVETVKTTISENYRSRHGKKATFVVCYPSDGAGVIDSNSILLRTPEN
ncbi:Galactokinase [Geodia barretti]|uniref:Galactokinase n=1 Tax=Geodia barretti TaxID=519541 RepID=A0AA35TTN4_GEOBA|nr:Galactokinase [Geodia barretti]